MYSYEVVRANVMAATAAVHTASRSSSPTKAQLADSEARQVAEVMEEVGRILAPVKDMTWASGRAQEQLGLGAGSLEHAVARSTVMLRQVQYRNG
jgi:hypothetical protein